MTQRAQRKGKEDAEKGWNRIWIEGVHTAARFVFDGLHAWSKDLPDQVRQVAHVLATAREPMSLDAIAECFTGKGPWKRRLPQIVETLESLGRARRVNDGVLGLN